MERDSFGNGCALVWMSDRCGVVVLREGNADESLLRWHFVRVWVGNGVLPGAQEMNVVSGDMGVDGVIVRFVLSTVRLGVELGGTPETRIRTAALFNALNVRRLLKGRVRVSRANNVRRLGRDDRRTATQNLEALPSTRK